MKVFDFDNTIYAGESLLDFFCFCAGRKKSLYACLPFVLYYLVLYKFNLVNEKSLYRDLNIFSKYVLKDISSNKTLIDEFWNKYGHKLKPQFLSLISEEDVIITGAPDFLIDAIKFKLNTNNIISSKFDLETKEIKFLCFGNSKAKVFQELFPDATIDEFYTDSLADSPMMRISKKSVLVKRHK